MVEKRSSAGGFGGCLVEAGGGAIGFVDAELQGQGQAVVVLFQGGEASAQDHGQGACDGEAGSIAECI